MDTEKLKELYSSRKSYKEIATELGISPSSVWRWIKKLDLYKIRPKIEDLTNKTFGCLEAKAYVKSGRYKNGGKFDLWKCVCLKCNKTLLVRSSNLKHGQQSCRICAASIVSDKLREYPIDYKIWFRMLDRCKRKNIELSVTPEYLYALFLGQNGKCALTGEPIHFGKTRSVLSTASPDRIDNSVGYIEGNIRWVHKCVNSMRHDLSTSEFITWCKKVTQFNCTN